MRKTLAVLLLLVLASTAWALTRRWSRVQLTTSSAPTGTCTGSSTTAACGLDIGTFRGYRVCVQTVSPTGQVLLGGGTAQAYYYDYDLATWSRSDTGLDFTVAAVGVSTACSQDYRVSVPQGRVYYAANAVTTSLTDGGAADGGVTVTVTGFYP